MAYTNVSGFTIVQIGENNKKKPVPEIKTADGYKVAITRIGDEYYAIANMKTIASGLNKKEVIKAAEEFTFDRIRKEKNIEIWKVPVLQLAAMVDNGEISKDKVISYYEKNYDEDIQWMKEKAKDALEDYCRSILTDENSDSNLQYYKHPAWKNFMKEASDYIGHHDYYNIMRYIIEPKVELYIKEIRARIVNELIN